jgi:hypothetical protein
MKGFKEVVRVFFKSKINSSSLALVGLFSLCSLSYAATFSPCDLNQDGVVNSVDVTLAVNMALGTTQCTASVEGADVCTVITVQRVVNASEGGVCVTYNTHGVTLNWAASASPNISGYDVYRGSSASGPFTMVNPTLVSGTTYFDSSVTGGQTYYYVVTAVNSSGTQSGYSTPVSASIPTP